MPAKKQSKSATGLPSNIAAAASYVLGPITGVIFLILEKDSFVRFHAMQSIVVFGGLFILQFLLVSTIILALFAPLISIVGFVLWLMLIYKAYSGEKWEAPLASKFTGKFLEKV